MDYSFDGHGLSREQLQAKAEAAELTGQLDGDSSHRQAARPRRPKSPKDACGWRGDAPEPELDDLAQACEENQQPSLRAEVCDWRGDKPERQEDDLGRICQSDNQTQKSSRGGKPVEQADAPQMPIQRLPKVAEIPEIVLPSDGDKSPDKKQDTKPPSELPARNGKTPEHGKRSKKNSPPPANIAGPSDPSPKDHGGEDETSAGDKTHSPWVDSLEQMPANVIEKVNLGIKQTLEAATRILTPPAGEGAQSPGPAAEEKTTKTTSLAPASAAPPPPDLYMPAPSRPSIEQPPVDDVIVGSKKQERERKRSERKARHEAKRKARRDKNQERKEKRRQAKERRRKEKEWKVAAKKGGDLPSHILQGLRIAPGSKIPYNPNCDICTKSAASVMSSKKRDPNCTTCAKAADREYTNKYIKSSNINLASLSSSLDDLLDIIRNLLRQDSNAKKQKGANQAGDQGRADEDLVQHISEHIRDFVSNGGEANLRGHKCNNKCQPGDLAGHGLDGNRDSPISTVSNSSNNSDVSTRPAMPAEVDWWVQAMSKESPSSTHRSLSPLAVTSQAPR
ncbi:hypothetical protein F5Y09DRAFT_353063 [Xylaria sp. FL1042]|nr:hypothetical protein F5Y09DRAFT_353063 [Xylaria sp. FL1042]